MQNGKTTPRIATPHFAEPVTKPTQPLVPTPPSAVANVTAKLAAMKQIQDLEIERVASMVAIINSAIPVINAAIGDPNHNSQNLAQIIRERGCDIAEDYVEIIIEDSQ